MYSRIGIYPYTVPDIFLNRLANIFSFNSSNNSLWGKCRQHCGSHFQMGKKHRAAMCRWLPIRKWSAWSFLPESEHGSQPCTASPGFHFCPGREEWWLPRKTWRTGWFGLGSRPMLPPFSPTLPTSTSLSHTHTEPPWAYSGPVTLGYLEL